MMISATFEPARQRLHQLEDLRLDRDVERRGRLVGDDQLGIAGERDGDHDALRACRRKAGADTAAAAAADRRCRPARAARRARSSARRAVRAAMLLQRLGDLPADGQHRIERGHRLLEHHADVAAAHLRASPPRDRRSRSRPSNRISPRGDAPRRIGDQAQDRQRADRLARAALADDRHGLAGIDGVGDAVDGAHQPRTGAKLGMQIPHVEECRHWSPQRFVPDPHTLPAHFCVTGAALMTGRIQLIVSISIRGSETTGGASGRAPKADSALRHFDKVQGRMEPRHTGVKHQTNESRSRPPVALSRAIRRALPAPAAIQRRVRYTGVDQHAGEGGRGELAVSFSSSSSAPSSTEQPRSPISTPVPKSGPT